MNKIYGVLIISKKPIDLSSVESDMDGVQHFVSEEFGLESNGKGGWRVTVNADKHCNDPGGNTIEAEGVTVSSVVVSWFLKLVAKMNYLPYYKKE